MAASVDFLRRFAGIDNDVATDDEVQNWIDIAVAWYARAGVPASTEGADYDYWVTNLAAWMYDHRGSGDEVPMLFVVSVHQLRPARGDG